MSMCENGPETLKRGERLLGRRDGIILNGWDVGMQEGYYEGTRGMELWGICAGQI